MTDPVTEQRMRKQNFIIKFGRGISDLEAEIIWALVQNQGCLCISGICRVANGFRADEYPCHRNQKYHANRRFYFGAQDHFKTTQACNQNSLGCCTPFMIIRRQLWRMEQKNLVQHERVLYRDHGRKGNHKDRFTFYFLERENFDAMMNKDTVMPFLEEKYDKSKALSY